MKAFDHAKPATKSEWVFAFVSAYRSLRPEIGERYAKTHAISAYKEEGWIIQDFDFGGTAKIKFSADGKEMLSCDNIELDTHDFELTKTPRRM